jgi:hypothetical protein
MQGLARLLSAPGSAGRVPLPALLFLQSCFRAEALDDALTSGGRDRLRGQRD